MEVVNVGGMSRRQYTLDRIGNRVRWWVDGHWLGAAELTAYRAGVPFETIFQARNYYTRQEVVGMDVYLVVYDGFGNEIDRVNPAKQRALLIAGGIAGYQVFFVPNNTGIAFDARIDATKLKLTKTVENHLGDFTKSGKMARPYLNSRSLMQEIIDSSKPIPDPGGVKGALRWDVQGAFNGTKGTWELVVDPKNNLVLHFLFKGSKP